MGLYARYDDSEDIFSIPTMLHPIASSFNGND
jgi:hypothetical protein